jgi:hypothetical protein
MHQNQTESKPSTPEQPTDEGLDETACSLSLPDRLRLTAYAKRSKVEAIHNEAADRIETLERTLADYIDTSEKLVYGAHGNAYLPGQMRTWLRATHKGKNVAANSPENVSVEARQK